MRVNPNMVPDILAQINQSQAVLNQALEVVSTGKSVNQPSDNPAAAAEMVQNSIESANVDQYTQNVSSMQTLVQSANSALSSVVSSLTSAVSLGTEGANGTTSASNLQALASQVQSILSDVISNANTSIEGSYIFGGTATSTAPYTADASSSTGYTYNGNSDSNEVSIGDNLKIQVGLPGSQIFSSSSSNVIGALSSLVSALQSGNSSNIQTATSAVSSAISYVGQQQAFYANAETQLNAQDTTLQQDTVTLTTQANNLTGANVADAATTLSQAETDNSAVLAAAAKVLPNTLLNYLSTPS
ncbi:MAG TPA: flagellar hook-associated protein FlgL [Acidobacteriaceae bacterium]|nr:flagellar hook-associated protein FlgL [Acidobacteriaceae bacterium]